MYFEAEKFSATFHEHSWLLNCVRLTQKHFRSVLPRRENRVSWYPQFD